MENHVVFRIHVFMCDDTRNLTYFIISVIMNAVENKSGN